LVHGRSPLSEICNDLILARSMPSGAVHTNSTAMPPMWFATVPALARKRGRVASGRGDIGELYCAAIQAKPSTVRCSCQPSGRRECTSSLSAVRSRGWPPSRMAWVMSGAR
jgi:hypothetical protein